MQYVCLNGQFIEAKKATILISDKEYFFDFSVYSSLKVIQGKTFYPEYHIDRLFESAEVIDLGHHFDKVEVLKWVDELVKKNDLVDAFLRMVLIGDAKDNINARLYIFALTGVHFYHKKWYREGVKVITFEGERRFPMSKTKDLLLSFLAYREAEKKQAIEALLVDNQGYIREGTRSNFFAIKNNRLISPPKSKILEGITKKIIFQLCEETFDIVEEDIAYNNLSDYDELFITSTLFNVLPICQIDDMKFESDFAKTKTIQGLFRKNYKKL